MENKVITVIMAAGEGTRMKSSKAKVMHEICGCPIIDYVVDGAKSISSSLPILVVGSGADEIKEHLGDQVQYAYQHQRLGTGHAVMMARDYLQGQEGYAVVLAGDIPLITASTLDKLVKHTHQGGYDAVLLSAILDNAEGYGRIMRSSNGDFECIVEHKDATEGQRMVKEINTSIYCFHIPSLLRGLDKLDNKNAQQEYYLTDVLGILKGEGKRIGVCIVEDSMEVLGINTRVQLAEVNGIMQQRINRVHMENGVTMLDPQNTYIGPYVLIGQDTTIYPGNVLEGRTTIGENCILYPNNRVADSSIGSGTCLEGSVILDSQIGEEVKIGPLSYIRPHSIIHDRVKLGNFVEVKNCEVGEGTKVAHLSYIGDGIIGEYANIGCGAVFVNYDGDDKYFTKVGDHAFIGCNVNLIAPIEIEDNTYIAAGSTITEKVPKGALAIARAYQVNKEGWVDKRKKGTEEDK